MRLADKKTKKSIPRPGTPARFPPKTVNSFADIFRGRDVVPGTDAILSRGILEADEVEISSS